MSKQVGNTTIGRGRQLLPLAVLGLAAILGGAFAFGSYTHRWGGGSDIKSAVESLESFPQAFGDWTLQDSSPMDSDVLDTLQCEGYVNRSYLNVATGDVVRVASIVGPAGPTAVHTPEICYSSRTYKIEDGPAKSLVSTKSGEHTFWKMDFSSRQPGGPPLIVYYAWTDDRVWEASESPRFEYGGSPYLYKIQVAGTPKLGASDESEDLCKSFLRSLLDAGWMTGESGTAHITNQES